MLYSVRKASRDPSLLTPSFFEPS